MPGKAEMVQLRIDETSGVDRPAHLHDGWLVMKSADDVDLLRVAEQAGREAADAPEEGTMPKAFDPSTLEDEVAKAAFEELVKERDEAIEARDLAVEAATAAAAESDGADGEGEDEVAKATSNLPEDVRAIVDAALAKSREETEELRKSAAEARAIADMERDARLMSEAVAKASKEMPNIPGGPEVVGSLMFRLRKAESALGESLRKSVAPEKSLADEVESLLKSVEGQLDSQELFKELGNGLEPEPTSAEGRLEKAAQTLREKNPEMTFEQAYAKAMDLNPKLARAAITGEEV